MKAVNILASTLETAGLSREQVMLAIAATFMRDAEHVLCGLMYGERPIRSLNEIPEEKAMMLRPMAETLAMLDGNAFFGTSYVDRDGMEREWWEQYVPEAEAIFDGNNAGHGGGWASRASFAMPPAD